jgi:hypothetical protein
VEEVSSAEMAAEVVIGYDVSAVASAIAPAVVLPVKVVGAMVLPAVPVVALRGIAVVDLATVLPLVVMVIPLRLTVLLAVSLIVVVSALLRLSLMLLAVALVVGLVVVVALIVLRVTDGGDSKEQQGRHCSAEKSNPFHKELRLLRFES